MAWQMPSYTGVVLLSRYTDAKNSEDCVLAKACLRHSPGTDSNHLN